MRSTRRDERHWTFSIRDKCLAHGHPYRSTLIRPPLSIDSVMPFICNVGSAGSAARERRTGPNPLLLIESSATNIGPPHYFTKETFFLTIVELSEARDSPGLNQHDGYPSGTCTNAPGRGVDQLPAPRGAGHHDERKPGAPRDDDAPSFHK